MTCKKQIRTLGIAAPAGIFDHALFDAGLEILREMGFETLVDDRLFMQNGYLAGVDADRAALLSDLFADKDVDAVMCARGGYGCMRILPLLKLKNLAQSRKPLIGFSDCTALFCALYKEGGLCWHGPVVTQMGALDKVSLKAFVTAAAGQNLVYKPQQALCLRPGRVRAPFFGGNLTVLSHMAGTPYFPNLAGHVLFLEDQNEAPYRVDRMLTQLKLMGVLDEISGLVLGDFINCGDNETVHARLLELLDDRAIPVLGNFPAGHGKHNQLLPLGAICGLDSEAQSLSFECEAVNDR